MSRYPAYLEIAEDGLCLAHVLELPGCTVRAPTRDEALRRLPAAIRDYHAWLRRYAEPAPAADESIQVEVAGESTGFGPFDPGDAAALFPLDREPVTPEEMERTFRLMGHARADLLALTEHLPDELLDWQPHPVSITIRRLLRHVGNAEEWYVSRLVPPETLPPEWEDDEALPLFGFLEMERRTAVARLRQLTEEERATLFYPTHWTSKPGEAWTAGKALRRFLEHEREHTAQAREILAARRHWLLARLATERAGLLKQLLDLDERTLTEVPILGDWTATDLLAHIAAWDRWDDRTMRCMVAREEADLTASLDLDATNAAFIAEWHDQIAGLNAAQTVDEAVTELQAARAGWLAWLESLPEEEFFRPRSCAGDDWSFPAVLLPIKGRHDAEHAEQIAAWRKAAGWESKAGSKAVLVATLVAAREELLAAAALIPPEEHASRPVCGEWTLKDVLGHVADWEVFGVAGLRQMAAGQPPRVEPIGDLDTWNQAHVAARRNQPWEVVWDDLHRARRELVEVLQGMSQAELGRSFPFPWGPEGTPYEWICVYFDHDREHAQDLKGEEMEP